MQTILIAMTILGCDDSVSQCHYVDTPVKRWETVAQCYAESEKRLQTYTHVHYPTVIAVCELSHPVVAAVPQLPVQQPPAQQSPAPQPAAPPKLAAPEPAPTGVTAFARKAIEQARHMLPSANGVRHAIAAPVHMVSDSYSWVAKRLKD